MAKYVVNSRLFSARNFILSENTQFRSSPLLVAAKRWEKLSRRAIFPNEPRLGTNTYFDNRIIETENGMWKYEKKNDNLILTKYSTKRDEYEMYILGEPKIELEKITSH